MISRIQRSDSLCKALLHNKGLTDRRRAAQQPREPCRRVREAARAKDLWQEESSSRAYQHRLQSQKAATDVVRIVVTLLRGKPKLSRIERCYLA